MQRFNENLFASVLVVGGVILFQVLVEVLTISWMYADLILPPRSLAMAHMYDGFAQAYFVAEDFLSLPHKLTAFIGPGFVGKLIIVVDLLAMNLCVGVPLALFLAVAATALGLVSPRLSSAKRIALLKVVLLLELSFLTGSWLAPVTDPPAMGALAYSVRQLVFDGTAIAYLILAVAATLSLYCLRATPTRQRTMVLTATGALVFSAGLALGVPKTEEPLPAHAAGPQPAFVKDFNVILISIDSLRADHLGAYGYQRNTSPTLDGLAQRGARFAHTSSTTSWTLPAHMSMMTGRSLLGHGVIWHDRKLADGIPMLAESLKRAGYATGAITSAPYVEGRYGFARGFDEYDDETIRFATNNESHKSVTAPLLQKTAAGWLERHVDQKFFLFLHYWDVHYDYKPGPPYDTMFDPDYTGEITGENLHGSPLVHAGMIQKDLDHVIALYDGEIRLIDDHVAKLLGSLSDLELSNKTIVVVTSDHGDEFFEHGNKGHQSTLYEEVLAVPLIIYVPDHAPSQSVVSMETSVADIMPTVLSLVGVSIPPGVEGADLSGVAFRGDTHWKRSTYGELFNDLNVQVSIQGAPRKQARRWKLIHRFSWPRLESYNLKKDPADSSNSRHFRPAEVYSTGVTQGSEGRRAGCGGHESTGDFFRARYSTA